ncbi:GvpL/GvpF family gas vesicle protein [Streptomyces sp. NPDC006012]|uniref:GvpL/GvpF family gas vesicle protein n=1 Tax=Streptomyces sp. NPDC006012 TaxID=3364739 RepID=UPI003696D01E
MSTYVYCIGHRGLAVPEGLAGVGDPPPAVRVVTEGDLAAVVSDAPLRLRPSGNDLRAHQTVVHESAVSGPVLPMSFGGVSADDAAVTAALAEYAEQFIERLHALDGRAEYHVKAAHLAESVLHRVLAGHPEIRALLDENRGARRDGQQQRMRLGELVAGAVKAREAEDARQVRHALVPLTEAVSVGPENTAWLVNISFLVGRTSVEEFLSAVERVRKQNPHLDIRITGPLPPYSFVEPVPAGRAGAVADAETA